MKNKRGYRITGVTPDSIAADLGLGAGDRLLKIGRLTDFDIFDYQLYQLQEQIVLTVQTASGAIEFEIDKDEDEDLGLVFEHPLLERCSTCLNNCIFCFIDQLPKGLRKSLYVKDDDLRLSFLDGNFATLTNLSDQELDRLIGFKLSPMNVSVHTTDPLLRQQMMNNPKAGRIMEQLKKIAAAGIKLNVQIVLCPGVNDEAKLERTLEDVLSLGSKIESIAVVPVGLTRYREQKQLTALRPFTGAEAKKLIGQIERYQQRMLVERGRRLIFASDEFYLLAQSEIPATGFYEDFSQYENGVGLVSLFKEQLAERLTAADLKPQAPYRIAEQGLTEQGLKKSDLLLIGTGVLARPVLADYSDLIADRAGVPVHILAVENEFFGERITVAGLLTGQDIVRQVQPAVRRLKAKGYQPTLVLPTCLLKKGDDLTLDDYTPEQLSLAVGSAVWLSDPDGRSLGGLVDYFRGENK